MPEHDVVLDVVYKKTAVPKYTLTVNIPATQNNDKVTVYFDKIVINGSEYQCYQNSTFSIYAGSTVTLGYVPHDGYNYSAEHFSNTFQSWKPTGFTISNNSFVMPEKNCSLTWTYSYTQWYKFSVGSSNTNCSPKVGLKETQITETSMWVKPGTTVWWNLNADASYTDFRVTFTGEVASSSSSAGHFTMPASNVTITGVASKKEYYTLKLSNPGNYTLEADNKTLTSSGIQIEYNKRVYLRFTPGSTTVNASQRTYHTLDSYSSSEITFDGNYFYMPRKNATITVKLVNTTQYKVSVGTFTGNSTLKVSTSSGSGYSASVWAAKGSTVYWKVSYGADDNECNIQVVKASDTSTEYKSWSNLASSSNYFTMPEYAVIVKGSAVENPYYIPFNECQIYSILDSSVSRTLVSQCNASSQPNKFGGFYEEEGGKNELDILNENIVNWPENDYLPAQFTQVNTPNVVLMATEGVTIYCAFAVGSKDTGTFTLTPCWFNHNDEFEIMKNYKLTVGYNPGQSSIDDHGAALRINMTRVDMADSRSAYIGTIEYYSTEGKPGILQRLVITIDKTPYAIDFAYTCSQNKAPNFYPGYTPILTDSNMYASPVIKSPFFSPTQASCWDANISLLQTDTQYVHIPLVSYVDDPLNIFINIGVITQPFDSEGNLIQEYIDGSKIPEKQTGLIPIGEFNQQFGDIAAVNSGYLDISFDDLIAKEIIDEDIYDIISDTTATDYVMFISIGYNGTLYTYVTNAPEDTKSEKAWIRDGNPCTWVDSDIYVVDEESGTSFTCNVLKVATY